MLLGTILDETYGITTLRQSLRWAATGIRCCLEPPLHIRGRDKRAGEKFRPSSERNNTSKRHDFKFSLQLGSSIVIEKIVSLPPWMVRGPLHRARTIELYCRTSWLHLRVENRSIPDSPAQSSDTSYVPCATCRHRQVRWESR